MSDTAASLSCGRGTSLPRVDLRLGAEQPAQGKFEVHLDGGPGKGGKNSLITATPERRLMQFTIARFRNECERSFGCSDRAGLLWGPVTHENCR